MKTTLTIQIIMLDDEMDKLDKRGREINKWSLELVEDIINDALIGELGIISKTTITKIE